MIVKENNYDAPEAKKEICFPVRGPTQKRSPSNVRPAVTGGARFAMRMFGMLTLEKPTARTDQPFDKHEVAADLAKLAEDHAGSEQELRRMVAQRLKVVLTAGRAHAEKLLLKDRQGGRCAERLCAMTDDIIQVLFEFVVRHLYPSENPAEAERMAIVATGGYGRGLMAPGSDIDLLFLLPYKQTAWGESVAEAILYCLWDLGLKVGHATRSVDESIRQARGACRIAM